MGDIEWKKRAGYDNWISPGWKNLSMFYEQLLHQKIYDDLTDAWHRAGVSNSKGLAGRMRHKVRSRGPHEYKIFELCVKIQFIWKNKENNSIFPFKSSFFLMFAGRIGASRGPRV